MRTDWKNNYEPPDLEPVEAILKFQKNGKLFLVKLYILFHSFAGAPSCFA